MKQAKRFIEISLVFILLITALCVCTACVNSTKMETYGNAEKYLIGSQSYDVADITTLNIDWKMGKVVLVEDPNATGITVVEDNTLPDIKKVHSYYHDGILDIKFWQSGFRSTVLDKDKILTVTYCSVGKLNVVLTSGTLYAEKLNAENTSIIMTSGDIDIEDLKGNTIELTMTSGDLDIDSIECNTFNHKMTSGNCDIDSIKAKSITMKQSSGNITVNKLDVDTFSSKSTSGDLNLSIERADNIDIFMTSGDAQIGIPSNGATVTVAKTSGSFKSNLDYVIKSGQYVFGEGQCAISIDMTSGSVRIK